MGSMRRVPALLLLLLAGFPAASAQADPLPPGCVPEPLPQVGRLQSAVEDAFKRTLGQELRATHEETLRWSVARKWMYAYHADERGYVWDFYGQTWLRGPGLPEEKEVNVEHTWPQSLFQRGWTRDEGSRDALDKDGMRGDLHNLFPTEIALNSARANKPFGEIDGCDPARSCSTDALFEPPDAHKGNAARALFYFSVRYGLSLPDGMEGTLRAWHAMDPPDAAEVERNGAIEAVQGNRNPFIDDAALADRIADF